MKKLLFLIPSLFLLTGCLLDDSEKLSELENRIASLEARPIVQRYQIVTNPEAPGKFTYLIDTQKGKIWTPVQFTDVEGKPTVWNEEEIIDNSGEIGQTTREFMSNRKFIQPKK